MYFVNIKFSELESKWKLVFIWFGEQDDIDVDRLTNAHYYYYYYYLGERADSNC